MRTQIDPMETWDLAVTNAQVFDPKIDNGPLDYQSILVPVDFSEHSNKTIQYVVALLRTGCAFQEIAAVARQMNVDLIVIGSHGNTGIKHFVLGSTAEKVVQYAPCPVLVVKDRISIFGFLAQELPSRLLVAHEGSQRIET